MFIFAKNIRLDEVSDFHNTLFIELREDSPYCSEWNIILQDPEQSIVFASTELYEFNHLSEDPMRKFKGFLSFSPLTTSEAVTHMIDVLNDYGVNYKPIYNEVRELTKQETNLDKKISFFINRTVNEIEAKSEIIIKRNNLLSSALKENTELSFEMLKRLCYAAEYKDEQSALHLVRISYYSTKLYAKIEPNSAKVNNLTYASLLHDIGKVGIPDAILLKPGCLTKEEFEVMKTHCSLGSNILSGSNKELVQMAQGIAYNHHEKWDGSGYPSGKSGKTISLTARVVAIADVFDALLSQRVYKPVFSIDQCVAIMNEGKQQHFDGELLEIFMSEVDDFLSFRAQIQKSLEESSAIDIFNSYFSVI